MPVILEGIVTTIAHDGRLNVAPMGPELPESLVSHSASGQVWDQIILKPFQSSTTFANLQQHRWGVFHVTDNVEMMALAVIHELKENPETEPVLDGKAAALIDCCRWYAFEVVESDASAERSQLVCQLRESGRRRDFFGLNRAKHAILEATILASRIGILPDHEVAVGLRQATTLVQKTGGEIEHRALERLTRYIQSRLSDGFQSTT